MNILIVLTLVASQILLLPSTSFRWVKEISTEALIIIALCSLIWKKNKIISLYIGWSVFTFFALKGYWVNEQVTPPEFSLDVFGLLTLSNVILFGIFYYILHEIKIDRCLIYKAIGAVCIFQSVYVIIQYLDCDQFFVNISRLLEWQENKSHPKLGWPVGTWGNETLVSWCIAICSPYLLAFNKLRYKVGYGISFIACLCTKSSAGLVAFIFGFIFWLFFKKRKIAVILFTLVILFAVYAYCSGAFTYYFNSPHLFKVWGKVIEIWHEKEITGFGLGSFKQIFWQRAPEFRSDGWWAQVHNDYLQVLFEQGIIGLGLMFTLFGVVFYNFFKKRKNIVPVTSLLISSMIMFWGFPMRTGMGFVVLLSLVLSEREDL